MSRMDIQKSRTVLSEALERVDSTVRLLALWTIIVPEMEAKIYFARSLETVASRAACLANRLEELGSSASPRQGVVRSTNAEFLGYLCPAGNALALLDTQHVAVIGRLRSQIKNNLGCLSPLADEPTYRILDDLVGHCDRMLAEISSLRAHLQKLESLTPIGGGDAQRHASRQGPFHAVVAKEVPEYPARDVRFLRSAPKPVPFSVNPPSVDVLGFLHHNLIGVEIPTIECCARILLDFPHMSWSFVADIARQIWDEARHASLFANRLRECGGSFGDFAHDHVLWVMAREQPLSMRLALHQRIGEWVGVDGVIWASAQFRRQGDEITAEMLDYVAADEMGHVRIGNRWLRHLVPLEIDRVHAEANRLRLQHSTKASECGVSFFPFNEQACRHSGFSDAETHLFAELYNKHGSILPRLD